MAKFGIGQPVRRVEDQRFITGKGRYTDDIDLEGQVYGCVVRSPEAHARIKAIDLAAAKAAPGVLAVITGADIAASGSNFLPCGIPMENRDGSPGIGRVRTRIQVTRPADELDRRRIGRQSSRIPRALCAWLDLEP